MNKKVKTNFKKLSSGYTIVELLVYIAIFAVFSILATNSLLAMTRAFAETRVLRDLNHSGVASIERISREIKGANSIDVASSSFSAHPGVLVLNSTDSGGISKTVRFYISNGVLKLDVDGAFVGDLTDQYVSVTNLVFRTFTTPQSTIVKVELTLTTSRGSLIRTENFYDSITLRGDY